MLVKERFVLSDTVKNTIYSMVPKFGYNGFGEIVFYRTYSRIKSDGKQETWNDVVIRVMEGTMSIRKDHYIKNNIEWDESFWQHYSLHMATAMFRMEWLPPGRGLWAMGSDFIYLRGSMALCNCAFTELKESNDYHWMMDCLMCGLGVGFYPSRDDTLEVIPNAKTIRYTIPDSREGWCDSVRMLIDHFSLGAERPIFDYSEIRPAGAPIKTFGGISSGPQPLIDLHHRIEKYFQLYDFEEIDSVALKTDIANAIGVCVVSGNVRRSAELACCDFDDPTFIDLKDYSIYPYRSDVGWMSNNSLYLQSDEDFNNLSKIADRVRRGIDIGFINRRNMPLGRIGKSYPVACDKAIGFNPCGEQPLEDKEVCTLAEHVPTQCPTLEQATKAAEYATVYASTVTLLPTHRQETNAVLLRNRRIGVGIIDYTGLVHTYGLNKTISYLKRTYKHIRRVNEWLACEAGVPLSIRVTTVKPGGTVPKLLGRTAGCGYPNFRYCLRRMRVAANSNLVPLLIEAGYAFEEDVYTPNTLCFEFPIEMGPAKPVEEASIFEQALNIVTLQREWSDNAVSNTIVFKPAWECLGPLVDSSDVFMRCKCWEGDPHIRINNCSLCNDTGLIKDPNLEVRDNKIYKYNPNHEEDLIEYTLAAIAPLTKSISLLQLQNKGIYPQMPEEALTEAEYFERLLSIKPIDWSKLYPLSIEDRAEDKYCDGESCQRL